MPSKCSCVRAPCWSSSANSVRYHHGTSNRGPHTRSRLVPTYRSSYSPLATKPASTVDGNVTGNHSVVENPGVETSRGGASTPDDDWIDHPSSRDRREGVPSNTVAAPDEATLAIAAPRIDDGHDEDRDHDPEPSARHLHSFEIVKKVACSACSHTTPRGAGEASAHDVRKTWRSRPVSRILCARLAAGRRPSLWRSRAAAPFAGAVRPTRELGRAVLERSLLGLAPGGACRAGTVARAAGELLPHRFTLTARDGSHDGGLSLLRFREVAPAWVSPAPCPSESGLSSTDPKIDRSRPAGSSAREHTAAARAQPGRARA